MVAEFVSALSALIRRLFQDNGSSPAWWLLYAFPIRFFCLCKRSDMDKTSPVWKDSPLVLIIVI